MKKITNEKGTFVYLKTEKDLKLKKIIILICFSIFIFIDIWNIMKHEFNYFLFFFKIIILLLYSSTYFKDVKDSENPIMMMKDGKLMYNYGKKSINFKSITEVSTKVSSYGVVAKYKEQDEEHTEVILVEPDFNICRLVIQIIKEYAEQYGYYDIKYKK